MAYYSQNGTGIDSNAYIYVQLQVTRTDYDTYSRFDLKSVAVSDTGTSGFIRGQVTTNQGGTSWTASTGWKDVYYNGTTTLATSSFNVDRGASDKTVRCGAYAEGGGSGIYAGGTDYAWLNVTVPKVLAPNAPTGCTATYVSDSQASVSWTNGTADTDHPRDATLVERKDGSNDWAQVASASGTASGYTDNGISPNGQYQYRVRAKNVAGYSAYSTSGSIYTTPAAPASVTLDKTAATTVQVDVTGTWGYSVTYDIESTYDGGSTWATVATSTSLPYSATVNAGTVQFRVRAVSGALSSAWTLSASLVTICPPLAPTIVQAPANPTAYGDGSTVAWTPNHPDGSTQSAAEVKVTNPGGTSTTYTVSTATSYSFTPNATGTWTAQVRTKGLDPSYGEWSQTVSWGVANPPSVVITSPATDGTDIVALPLNVAWTVTDSTGVSAQRIIIEGSDGEILNRTLAGDVRTVALNASDVALENGQTYTIRLRVMGGSGLVTEQTRIFDVAWLAPASPVLQLTEGEGRSATIDVMDTHYSESGATIAVDGSAIADSFTVFGNSTQDGTPTPSAPVAIESIGSRNLSPFFSHDLTDVYNATTNPNGYWFWFSTEATYTQKDNGWVHVEYSNTGSSAVYPNCIVQQVPALKNGELYTFMVEIANATISGDVKFSPNGSSGSTVAYLNNVAAFSIADNSTYYKSTTAKSDFSGCNRFTRSYFNVPAGGSISLDLRISIYDGYYFGAYQPPGTIGVNACGRNLWASIPAGTYSGVTLTANSDGSVTLNGTASATVNIETMFVVPMTGTYRISGCPSGGGSSTYQLWTYDTNTPRDQQITDVGSGGTGTLTAGHRISLRIRVQSGYTCNNVVMCPMLAFGSDAQEFMPYTGFTTPIDLQGNSLRSLPDGTRDELRVEGGSKVLVKRCEETQQAVTDGVTGTVGVDVLSSTGQIENDAQVVYKLATPQEIDLGSVSDLPFIPEDGEMWVDGTEMEAVLRPADYAGQPTIESVDVQRVNADGTAWTVATGLTVGGSCIDPLPPLGVDYTYRAVASAASGATSSVEASNRLGGCRWALNFGQAASACKLVGRNPSSSVSYEHGGELYHFARGFQNPEDMLPEFYPVGSIDANGTLEFDAETRDEANEIMALMFQYPVAWLRTPFGERRRVRVKPTYNLDRRTKRITVSYDLIRFGEAW